MNQSGSNDPCPCGSGRKYRQCCLLREPAAASRQAGQSSIPGLLREAIAHYQAGRLPQAEAIYRRILQIEPDNSDALHLLGVLAHQVGRSETAVELIGRAIRVHPSEAMYHNNLAMALETQGRLDEAAAYFRRALQLKPGYALAYFNLGNVLRAQGDPDGAIECYRNAIACQPDHAEAHNNLGNVLNAQGRPDEAAGHYLEALALKPDYAEAHNNLGNLLKGQGRLEEAAARYRNAIALQPHYAEAHVNLGNALKESMQMEAALASYDQAIAIQHDQAEGHWNKALLSLLLGDFENGWAGYEWRWKNGQLKLPERNFDRPLWLGKESLAGKTVLLHGEQGLGDTIQFCRYARMAADNGARVVLEVGAPLLGLLASLDGVAQLVAYGEPLPPFDCHCPLLSLPLAFGTSLDSIPAATGYLAADQGKVAQWQARLGDKSMPRAGLVWSGNARHANDRNRSVPLADLLRHLPDGHQYVSLQKELRDADREILRARPDILHPGDELADFSDTAALCELMDVVISVDTSVAHLAGALGRPTWILLPFVPDWRWLLDRRDSPWYPTAKLYRQERAGDWRGVFARIGTELQAASDIDRPLQ